MESNRIKCGRCNSEYAPRKYLAYTGTSDTGGRPTNATEVDDASCPVCGYGVNFKENSYPFTYQIPKKILLG